MEQLTAKNGEKKWKYEGDILIAIPDEYFCENCVFDGDVCMWKGSGLAITCNDFDTKAVFTIKSSEPCEK